jgi:muconate cycloisomerase
MGGGQAFYHSECLVVLIEAANGMVGWGEASAAPSMTGDTLPGMLEAANRYLAPVLIGADASDYEALSQRLQRAIVGNTGAKAACEIALHDLAGKCLGKSVTELLGGKRRDSIRVMHMLGNPSPEEDLAESLEKQRAGYSFIKLKVGVKPVAQEAELARTLRRELGADYWLCADANTGMSRTQAYEYVEGAKDAGLLFLEQPFGDDELEETAALARISPVPLCADEALHGLRQIREWHAAGAIAGVNLKTIKLGGLQPTMQAAVLSDSLGLKIDLAAKLGESSIGTAALVHLAYTVPNLDWGANPVSQYLAVDLVRAPIKPHLGSVALPTGSGLGVEVDEATLRHHQVKV